MTVRGIAQLIADNVTGKIPKTVRFLGQSFAVASWRDVLEKTLNAIGEVEPDAFANLAQEYPRFISKEATSLRQCRSLSNGYFIEVHLSAKSIYRFSLQALASVGLSTEDWSVEAAS